MEKTHAGIFEGIGGFSYAAEQAGYQTVLQCENNEFCKKVLRFHFPKAELVGDIKQQDFRKYENTIDLFTAGFPCQPYSISGKRGGQDDDRYLWPETRRAIREIQPRRVLLENVAGLLSILEPKSISKVESKALQLFGEDCNNGDIRKTIERVERRVIGTIIKEIEAEGYLLPKNKQGEPIVLCIPACGVNAPHRRDRIWFIAYRSGIRSGSGNEPMGRKKRSNPGRSGQRTGVGIITDTDKRSGQEHRLYAGRNLPEEWIDQAGFNPDTFGKGPQGRQINGVVREGWPTKEQQLAGLFESAWGNFPTQSPLRNGNDGLSSGLDTKAISYTTWRIESIKGGGNAIVPQVAFQIIKSMDLYEDSLSNG